MSEWPDIGWGCRYALSWCDLDLTVKLVGTFVGNCRCAISFLNLDLTFAVVTLTFKI